MENQNQNQILNDDELLHIWEGLDENDEKITTAVPPYWYANNGIPIDEYGDDMVYVHTELIKPNTKCTHITGLCALMEEDEYIIIHEYDGIDFNAGDNIGFNFCPKCGAKL